MGALTDTVSGPDPEAQLPRDRTCRLLDWALAAALLLLTALCAACAARLWALPGSAPSLSSRVGPEPTARSLVVSDSLQDGFAQLVASNAQLTNGTLSWHSDSGLAGVFLTPGFSYDRQKQELVVKEGGIYYVFLQLELQRVVAGSASGWVSVALHQQPERPTLTLTITLPTASSDSAGGSRNCLLRLSAGQRLTVRLQASAAAHPAWQMVQGATVLGLLRMTSETSAGLRQLPPPPA